MRLSLPKDQGSRQGVATGREDLKAALITPQFLALYHNSQAFLFSQQYDLLVWLIAMEARMDVCSVIQERLKELGLEQRELAAAAQVTESYISQLLTRKKCPPAADRTDIYEKMNAFLKFPKGRLSAMVEAQRTEEWKKRLADPPAPLYKEVRDLVIRKCRSAIRNQIREIFERQAFGEVERLVTQKLLDVAKKIAERELVKERWLRSVAKLRRQTYEEARSIILEFLDTDVFSISVDHCATFLSPMIDSWDIDFATFGIEVRLNPQLSSVESLKFQYVEREDGRSGQVEPGFEEFLRSPELRRDATEEELDFLRNLGFPSRRPTALYYYRTLQDLRDPLHFQAGATLPVRKRSDNNTAEKRRQLLSRKKAVRRWTKNAVNSANNN
jgi:transcriptional regulator with XRE-family HTH domain